MISIFTCPKPFKGNIKILQENAIRSWKEECPNSEILLAADEEGVATASTQFGIRHIQNIQKNKFGSPMLDSLFRRTEQEAHGKIMIFISTDCMLIGNLEKIVETVKEKFNEFLLVGVRYDSEISEKLPDSNWREFVLENRGLWHPIARRKMGKAFGGTDLFIFPKGLLTNIPPFAVGVTCWDGWIPYDIKRRKIPMIDISESIDMIHQKHPARTLKPYYDIQLQNNKKLMIGKKSAQDADFFLIDGKFERQRSLSFFK